MGDQLDLESGRTVPPGGSRMRDVGLVGVGITLGFALAVVGHGRNPRTGDPDEGDQGDHP
jgi:hypothetical protein